MMPKQMGWWMFWQAEAKLRFDPFVCFPPQILAGEVMAFFMRSEGTQEKTIVTADCCYFNPLLRRVIRFLGTSAWRRTNNEPLTKRVGKFRNLEKIYLIKIIIISIKAILKGFS